jgi:trimeric autotransporter adhesin
VTPTTNDPNSTVTVNGTAVTSGNQSGPISLVVGANVITTVVTAQDGTTRDTYTLTVTRAPSALATLSNLVISSGTLAPTFVSGVANYTAQVDNNVSSITVTPTTTDAAATVTVNGVPVTSGTASGPIALQFGQNVITTVVTAQDGTTTGTYTLTVTRIASSTATLSNLTISSGTLAPAFTSATTSYAASVTNATTSITVTPTATDPTSTITVNGTAVTSGSASGPIALQIGSNLVTIVVTAQDGITTGTYTVTVDRPALTSVVLNNLTISTGSLAPAFDSQIFSYASAVGNTTTSLTVTATTSDATATLTINGTPVGSGTPSGPIDLQVGANVITVVVRAQSGLTTTYTITVARASSSDALLTNLVLSNGTLSPAFGSNIDNYTSSVDNSVSEITVTPTAEDVNATIKVNGILVNSGSPSGLINLPLDDNIITVLVTAETVQLRKLIPSSFTGVPTKRLFSPTI